MVETNKFTDNETEEILTPLVVEGVVGEETAEATAEAEAEPADSTATSPMTPEEEARIRLEKASGITGATIGFFLGGPILAAIAGFGSAYAVRKENGVGDAARRLGEFGLSVGDKAREVDQEHEITGKTKQVLEGAWGQVERLDRNIASKIQQFFVNAWSASLDYTKEHRLIERGVENTGRSFEYLASKVSPGN